LWDAERLPQSPFHEWCSEVSVESGTATSEQTIGQGKLVPWPRLEKAPWWALALALAWLWIFYSITSVDTYRDAFLFISQGIVLTVRIALSAYAIAVSLGLILGLGRVSKNAVFYNLATLYVEVVRGLPMLIIVLYGAYVVVPGIERLLVNYFPGISLGGIDDSVRGTIGLGLGYAAFEAEVYRAGIQSIERGQMEAARSLGMSYTQAMRYIILPQAIRRILPPLGNDLISILKDSSLVSALAVRELTQMAKLNRARTFLSLESYNTVAFLYLTMTLMLSMTVKFIERRLRIER
jgi:polar amino acid transport system permease protein